MSRAATAYSQQVMLPPFVPDRDDNWPGRGSSEALLVLGDDEFYGGPRPILLDADDAWTPPLETGYLDQQIEMPPAYYSSYNDKTLPSRRPIVTPRLMLAAAIVVLLAIGLMLVTPVLASNRFGGGATPLSISRYSDMSKGAPARTGESPVIDTTTSSQQAAPQVSEPAPPSAPVSAPSRPGEYNLVAPPSTSVRQIESVLTQYGSPAAGQGQVLYDLGVQYGIDPAYALAFFVHESGCGTKGVARFTNSLGNIRWTEGFENYEGYRKYSSWADGFEDWYKLITDLYINGWNLRTVDAIIPVYAPSADRNNPPVYIANVKSLVDSWRGK